MRTNRLRNTLILTVLLGGMGCEDEQLLRPGTSRAVDPLFTSYVAIGNSITAGIQSGGLNDSLQAVAYPVLLARAMNTTFIVPFLNRPGCPAPIDTIFTKHRLLGTGETFCALRRALTPPPLFYNNIGVPGADVVETINYFDPGIQPSPTDVYRTMLLGGYTQIEMARRARPTFVSVWIGNNDVLGAILDTANSGNPALVTTPANFSTRLTALLDSLDQIGTVRGGVLVGVVQAILAPYSSQGRAYAQAALLIPTLTVLPNCLAFQTVPGGAPPLDTVWVSVPFHYGAPLVARAAAGVPTTLDCSVPQVISTAEGLNMVSSVAQYNAAIQAAANARGWAYVDPNPLLAALIPVPGAIRPFPAFPPDPNRAVAPFGTALSRDGLHPSTSTQRLIAQALQAAINAKYGTAIPAIP
jgi:hypothetical protein